MRERFTYKRQMNRGRNGAGISCGCLFALLFFVMITALSACDSSGRSGNLGKNVTDVSETAESRVDTGFVVTNYNSFDSADTAIVIKKNTEEKTITFWNRNVGKTYTLSFDGTTAFQDKYGQNISVAQIAAGDIVDVTFLKSKKHLTTLNLSPQVWSLERVAFFELDALQGVATIGQEEKKYKLSANTHYFSDGKSVDLSELSETDTLSFQGIDTEVLTVKVEKGHGYLRITGQEKFLDGWMEIGQSKIQRIKDEMVLPLPEGAYRIVISKDNNGGEKNVVIHRNEETVLDISDLEVAEPEKGTILFTITPSNAKLYVDGEKVDASMPVTLVYGIHQLMIKADGYQTLTQYVRVGQASAGIDISLDPVKDESQEDGAGTDGTDVTTSYYKVYVDAPAGVEVFLDGNYVGMTPCSFQKVEGSHVILLRKTGYQSKSYTLQISGDDKDISYSFADLELTGADSSNTAETDLNSIISDVLGTLLE